MRVETEEGLLMTKPVMLWTYPGSLDSRVLVRDGKVVESTHPHVPLGMRAAPAAKILRACGWRLPRRVKNTIGARGGVIRHDEWRDACGRRVPTETRFDKS